MPVLTEEWRFEARGKSWRLAGWTRNIDAEDFDLDKENQLVVKCKRKILEVLEDPNKFEKRLAKMLNIPIDKPETRDLFNNVLYVNDSEMFCMGTGGRGGGKVYWTPYTSRNEWRDKEVDTLLECDNCRVLAHEDMHGLGSETEEDLLSYLIGIYFRIENFSKDMWGRHIIDTVDTWAWKTWEYAVGRKRRDTRIGRNSFCALYTRYPRETVEILRDKGYEDNVIEKIVDTCK